MKTIIGGLLVVSLMSGPAVVKAEVLAYEVLKNQNKIICLIRKEAADEAGSGIAKASDVDAVVANITEKNNRIKSLIKEKDRIVNQIQTALDLRVYTKTPLTQGQMQSFTEFTALYKSEGGAIQESLYKIEQGQELGMVIDEILHNHTDCSLVLHELTAISDFQSDAIFSLNAIIHAGEKAIEAFEASS